MSNPPLVARLVGIGNYSNYPQLRPGGDINADNLEKFLKQDFIKGDHDIKSIKDAPMDTILKELKALLDTFDRNKAVLFFFSGYGGGTEAGTSVICPADIGKADKSKGITDQVLGQLFDSISRVRGNNITFFLDCPSPAFEWGNPSSFVVVAPRRIVPNNRQSFTDSIISVLSKEKESIEWLTVESFAAKIHAMMPSDIEVDCYGQNVDRTLFNLNGGRAHYAFISCRAEADGSLTLFAGSAHRVKKGATYGIYSNHVDTKQHCLGYLDVNLVKDATTAKLYPPPPNLPLPPVFYAVETHCSHETVDIFSNDVDTAEIKSPSWKEAKEDEAHITLKLGEGKVEFLWNGFADPRMRVTTRPGNNISVMKDNQELMKVIRHAARFTYYIGSSSDSSSPPLFEVEFKEVGMDNQQPKGNDLLRDGLVNLNITKDNRRRTFCLILRNMAEFDIWPFVFMCDPISFTILPWYIPKKALAFPKTAESKSEINIGCGDEEDLMFAWRPESKVDLFYIKIFVTKERTSFSFLQQIRSSIEDKLREVGQGTPAPPDSGGRSENPKPPSDIAGPSPKPPASGDWDAMTITVKRMYDHEEVKSDALARDRLFPSWLAQRRPVRRL